MAQCGGGNMPKKPMMMGAPKTGKRSGKSKKGK